MALSTMRETILVEGLVTVLVEASFVVFEKISSPIFPSSSMGCAPVVGLCAQPLGVRREK